ncbi:MAG TPA: hypothetical protein VH969_17940 [Actinophytocola sp.]|uniref:hypothetical protein n=1 Tax=Actinophytocola sp. TaxID=1872138 RepID=UPI002F95BF3C
MTHDELPGAAGLRPTFAVTVLAADEPAAFGALRDFLRDALTEPGRAYAVRILGESLLTDPADEVAGLGPLGGLGFDGLYLNVRQRWQSPKWADEGLYDLTHELTVALRRGELVALHTPVSAALLRGWVRAGAPYRFLPDAVLDAYERESPGAAAAASSRLTSGARLDFRAYLAQVTEALDILDKAAVAEDTPR